MSKFKIDDVIVCKKIPIEVISNDGTHFHEDMRDLVGREMIVERFNDEGNVVAGDWNWPDEWIDLAGAEDRTTCHPHHDVIVAWARGAKVRGRVAGSPHWQLSWSPYSNGASPGFHKEWEYEVIDNSAEISQIEQEIRNLADRLEKLKRE